MQEKGGTQIIPDCSMSKELTNTTVFKYSKEKSK